MPDLLKLLKKKDCCAKVICGEISVKQKPKISHHKKVLISKNELKMVIWSNILHSTLDSRSHSKLEWMAMRQGFSW